MVTVFPSLSAVGSWEEVLLFSMDFTVSQNLLEFVLQDANFCLKMLAFAFLTDCVYWFLTSMKSRKSWGLFNTRAVRHRMFLCWSRVVKSGVNKGLSISVLSSTFFEWGMLIYDGEESTLKEQPGILY